MIKGRHILKHLAGGLVYLPDVMTIVLYKDTTRYERFLLRRLPKYFDIKVHSHSSFNHDEIETHCKGKFFLTKAYSLDLEVEDERMIQKAQVYIGKTGWAMPPGNR